MGFIIGGKILTSDSRHFGITCRHIAIPRKATIILAGNLVYIINLINFAFKKRAESRDRSFLRKFRFIK